MSRIFLTLLLAAGAFALQAKDIQKVVLTTTPQMHCQKCETKIKNQLRFEKGVKLIEVSIPEQTVTVTYDAEKTTPERLIDSLKKIKYNARTLKEGEQPAASSEASSCPS